MQTIFTKLTTMIQKTSIILIILTFFVSSLLAGVSTDKGLVLQDGKITISVTNKPIKEILDMIEKEGKCRFMYDDNLEYMNKSVSINVKDVPISVFLEELFKNTDLVTQSMENNLIVITTRAIAQSTGILKNNKKSENADSQQLALTGIVKDLKTNEPIPFVSVIIKEDKSKGTFTDENGKFTIYPSTLQNTLQLSIIGYKSIEVPINGRRTVDILMEPELTALDAVMIVAYGTAKRSTYTGSAATVSEDRLNARPVTAVSQALAGTTAGLQISTSNGQPGSVPTIRVRGLGSFNASNEPLIVLDGMPYDNSLTSINPNDIESVTILKDASSAALYGARAANGVLLITTKKGKIGKVKVDAKYNLGLTTRQTADYKTVGTRDYMQLYWESTRNSLMYSGATREEANARAGSAFLAGLSYNPYNMDADQLFDPSTGKINPEAKLLWPDDLDWRGAIEQLGIRHDADFSISGANDKTDYYTSIGYLTEQGYIIGSELTRYSAKANINSQVNKWLKVGVNLNSSVTESQGNQNESSGNNSNPFRFLRYVGNIFPIHLHNPETGEYIYDQQGNKLYDFGLGYTTEDGITVPKRDFVAGNNPAIELQNIYDGYRRNTINAKTYAELTFLKDFKFSVNVGVGTNAYRGWSGTYVYKEKGNAGTSTKSSSETTTWTINQLLTYSKEFGQHHFDAMLGHESYDYEYNYHSSSMKGQIMIGSNFEFKNFTEVNGIPNSYINKYRVEGFLSRINYDYDNTYFGSVSFRRDGTSRFYEDARWGNFWSAGVGWRVDKEQFMKNLKFIDLLKIRASYGVVGNDDLDSYYPWRATYYPYPNGTEPGYLQDALGNKELSWEVSHNFDVAAEFSLFNSSLSGTFEFFNRESSNLLFDVPQPLSSGVETQSINAGTMYNRGIEATFDYDLIKKRNFKMNINLNATFLENKIKDLPLDPYVSSVYKIEEGHPRYEFWLRQWKGVNPETGYNLFEADLENESYVWGEGELIDVNGIQCTEVIEHAKYDWSGNATPLVTGGFGSVINYKNWSFSFNFYYQLGGKYYDSTYESLMTVGTASLSYSKLHVDLLNRWRESGDITKVAKLSSGTDSKNIGAGTSSRWLVSSNMLELTNVNLSYSFPKKVLDKLSIDGIKVYFSADNSLLVTARRGMFPRRTTFSGYDGNADIYLPSRTFSFGINMNF